MATHSIILAREISWTEEPSGLQSTGSQRVRHFLVIKSSSNNIYVCVRAKSLQSHHTLCDPKRLRPTGLLCPWDSPGKNTGVGCRFLLRGNFLTQGWNPCLLTCRRILYRGATGEAHIYTYSDCFYLP